MNPVRILIAIFVVVSFLIPSSLSAETIGKVTQIYVGDYNNSYGRCYVKGTDGKLYHFTLSNNARKAMYSSAVTAMVNNFTVHVTVESSGPVNNEYFINKLVIDKN